VLIAGADQYMDRSELTDAEDEDLADVFYGLRQAEETLREWTRRLEDQDRDVMVE
jgi:hypothetical protein